VASFLGSSSIDIGIGIDDFGLEIDQLNQLPLRDIGEIPLLHGNLVLGDIRLLGSLVMVLAGIPASVGYIDSIFEASIEMQPKNLSATDQGEMKAQATINQ
jgi:hypothetical protein